MAFRFRLEKVARYRQKLVDEQGRVVARAQRVVSGLEARWAAVSEDIAAHLHDLAGPAPVRISVQEMMARTAWISHLEDLRQEIGRDLQQAQQDLAQRRERLNELWQDLEVLKKLRARQELAWRKAQAKQESLFLDEIGQQRAARQRRSKVAT
jgi:flagellar export protein FliJ